MKLHGLDKYRVEDLILDRDGVRLVFLLESPYTDEIVHGHPLAGGSGRGMARFLVTRCSGFDDWDPNTPLGCQITRRRETRIALVNGANYPLDKNIYCPDDYAAHRQTIDAWDLIRKNPNAMRRNDPAHPGVEDGLVRQLAGRLARIPETALVVPCGNFARAFLKKCAVPCRTYPRKVPHPARNLWFSPDRFGDLGHFIDAVNLAIETDGT